jgi:hypothetical protein
MRLMRYYISKPYLFKKNIKNVRSFTYYFNLIDTNGLDNNHDWSCAWYAACNIVFWCFGLSLLLTGIVEWNPCMVIGGVLSPFVGYFIGMIPGAICTYCIVRRGEAFYHIADCMEAEVKRIKEKK